MDELTARDFPLWAGEADHGYTGRAYRNNLYGKRGNGVKAERITEEKTEPAVPKRMQRLTEWEKLKRRHGLALILVMALGFYGMIVCLITGTIVHHNTAKSVREEMAAEYAQQLQDYQEAQQLERSKEYFLSGDASKESWINQTIDAGARFIAGENAGDTYKCTKLGVAIARAMNNAYPNDVVTVMQEENQFSRNYSETYSAHDRELSEKVLRPFLESGIIPNGLTENMVYFNDANGVARDTFLSTAATRTWEYQG